MKHYAGSDLSMETTQVCMVDENGRTLVSEKVESSPEAIAGLLERYHPIERAVIETGRMSPAICLGLRELSSSCAPTSPSAGGIVCGSLGCSKNHSKMPAIAPRLLRSLTDGRLYPIFRDLGSGSEPGSLDAVALVEAR